MKKKNRWGSRSWRQIGAARARKKGVFKPQPTGTQDSRIQELVQLGLLEIAQTTDETKQKIVGFMANADITTSGDGFPE